MCCLSYEQAVFFFGTSFLSTSLRHIQDQRVPSAVFHVLHAAAEEIGREAPASKLLVKKWISVLVSGVCFNIGIHTVIGDAFILLGTDQAKSLHGARAVSRIVLAF